MKRIQNVWMAAVVSVCIILTGCSSTTPTQKGALLGGGAGAGIGALWATHHNHPILSTWEGAAVGAAAGAATGALIGDALDEYADDNAADDKGKSAAINDLQRQLSEKDGELDVLRSQALTEKEEDPLVADLQRQLLDAEAELNELRNQPGLENVQVESVNGQLRFTILNEVLFSPGKTELRSNSRVTLDSVLAMIQQDFSDREIVIEGHCDSDPIHKSQWRDNWELSYNRSMAVLYYYMNQKRVSGERMKAVACGAHHPVAPNDTAANKRQNRRAVIVVMPPKEPGVVARR